jgi:hypothetical protein
MATEVNQEDYLSHHFESQYRKRLMGDAKPLQFTTTGMFTVLIFRFHP